MALMGKCRLWESTEYVRDGKVQIMGKHKNMVVMGKCADYGKAQNMVVMGKCRLWGWSRKVQNMGCSQKAQKLLKFTSFKTIICTVQIESFQDHYKM